FVAVHPADGEVSGLTDGGFAALTTRHGGCVLKVVFDAGQRRATVFAPIHWSDVNAAAARVGELVAAPADPFSRQPRAKATPAALAPVSFRFRGFAVTRRSCDLPYDGWWVRVTFAGGSGLLFATDEEPAAWHGKAEGLFGPDAELAEYADALRQIYRVAA